LLNSEYEKKEMNIVLVIFDSLRKDCIGAYGSSPFWGKVRTPHLNELAKESLMMTSVFPESLPTLPARRALYTGLKVYPFINSDFHFKGDFVGAPGWGPIPENQDVLAEILKEDGYRTGLISSVYHMFKPSKNYWRGFNQWTFIRGKEIDPCRSGPFPSQEKIDYWLPRKMQREDTVALLTQQLINAYDWKHEEDYPAAQVMIEACKWLEENRNAKKMFLVVESFDPHEPWLIPEQYRRMYDTSNAHEQVLSGYSGAEEMPPEILYRTQANYSGSVTMCDRWFGHLYETMEDLGLLDNTLLIVTSDHGHSIGDDNYVGKRGYPSSREVFDIPLLIRHPEGIGAGEKSDLLIQHLDIPAMTLGFAGIKVPKAIDGIDFWKSAVESGKSVRDHATAAWGPTVTVIDSQWWLNCKVDGKGPFLYNLTADPLLKKNVTEENKDVVDRLFAKAISDAGGSFPDYLLKLASEKTDFPGCSPIAARL